MQRNKELLNILHSLSITQKEMYAKEKLLAGIELAKSKGKSIHVCCSGGIDSCALVHFVHSVDKTIKVVFSDTGQEFSEIKKMAVKLSDTVVRPKIPFHVVVEKYGYPAISKNQARNISDVQNPTEKNLKTRTLRLTGIKSNGQKGVSAGRISNCYMHLIDKVKLSDKCCDYLKKQPLKKYEKNNNSVPIIGEQASESDQRFMSWSNNGCFSDKGIHPFYIFAKHDILTYILKYDIEYPVEIYGEIIMGDDGYLTTSGEKRTGCCGCLFGIKFDKKRFVRLREIDPKKWNYYMNCGAGKILELLGLPTGEDK